MHRILPRGRAHFVENADGCGLLLLQERSGCPVLPLPRIMLTDVEEEDQVVLVPGGVQYLRQDPMPHPWRHTVVGE